MAKASFYSSTGVTSNNINAIEDSKNAAAASATQAEASKVAAAQSASDANAAKLAAQSVQADVEDAETNSAASATAAASSAAAAATSLAGIGNSETNAATSASNSAASASAAAASALSASSSATSAASDAASAATSLSNIGSAETNAAASATAAASSATSASTDAASASASQVAAAASEAASATSEANSATSETNAATSASQAATSATNSATSETNAASSASSASTSASNAATSASAASASQVSAAASAASAANSYDLFDDRYLGTKTSDVTVDNDGNALVAGALYFNSTANEMRVYDGANWIAASSAGGASLLEYKYTATSGQTTFSGADDNANSLSYTQDNLIVTLNGVVLENGTDYTATTGTSVVLASGAATSDELNVIAFKTFTTADMVAASTGGTFYGDVDVQGTLTSDGLIETPYISLGNTSNSYQTVTGSSDGNDLTYRAYQNHIFKNTTGASSSTDGTERMRIGSGSDGAIMFGTTNTAPVSNNVVGISARGTYGELQVSTEGSTGAPLYLNRKTSDGDIAVFRKDGSSVGSIYNGGGNLGVNSSGGLLLIDDIITPTSGADATHDIGRSSARYKDLYLSGIAYANYVGSSGDTDTIIAFDTANTVRVVTAGSERIRIKDSGNVGINESSPATKLHVSNSTPQTPIITVENPASHEATIRFKSAHSAASDFRVGASISASNNFEIYSVAAAAPRLAIDSSGNMMVGKTNVAWYDTGFQAESSGKILGVTSDTSGNNFFARKNNATGTMFAFWYNTTNIGNITSGTSSVSYNTSSDYRLKENVTDVTDGITRVKQLAPKRFNFIADPDTTVDGFIAHEAQAVVPEAVTGTKDAMRDEEYEVTPAVLDDDGNVVTEAVMGTRSVPDYQGIDQSKLVPLLTAALQEAIAKIETLETEMTSVKARLDALEAN